MLERERCSVPRCRMVPGTKRSFQLRQLLILKPGKQPIKGCQIITERYQSTPAKLRTPFLTHLIENNNRCTFVVLETGDSPSVIISFAVKNICKNKSCGSSYQVKVFPIPLKCKMGHEQSQTPLPSHRTRVQKVLELCTQQARQTARRGSKRIPT